MQNSKLSPLFLSLSLLSLLLLASCKSEVDQAAVAAETAKAYYEQLMQGKYGDFVDGVYRPDSIPDSYRSQLADDMHMFADQMVREHGGMKSVSISNSDYDEEQQRADVYLTITFRNGDIEQILVPMELHDNLWYMH